MSRVAAQPRLSPDALAYLRVRVWNHVHGEGMTAVKLVDRYGTQIEDFLIVVPEKHLITLGDAKKIAGGGR